MVRHVNENYKEIYDRYMSDIKMKKLSLQLVKALQLGGGNDEMDKIRKKIRIYIDTQYPNIDEIISHVENEKNQEISDELDTIKQQQVYREKIVAPSFKAFCVVHKFGKENKFSLSPIQFYEYFFFSLERDIREDVVNLFNENAPRYYLHDKSIISFKLYSDGDFILDEKVIELFLNEHEELENKKKLLTTRLDKIIAVFAWTALFLLPLLFSKIADWTSIKGLFRPMVVVLMVVFLIFVIWYSFNEMNEEKRENSKRIKTKENFLKKAQQIRTKLISD